MKKICDFCGEEIQGNPCVMQSYGTFCNFLCWGKQTKKEKDDEGRAHRLSREKSKKAYFGLNYSQAWTPARRQHDESN